MPIQAEATNTHDAQNNTCVRTKIKRWCLRFWIFVHVMVRFFTSENHGRRLNTMTVIKE
jgi:hypothetical protein